MRLRTKVFELAQSQGYSSDRALAKAMGVSPALVSRVRSGELGINKAFITGALGAFPGKTLNELFYTEPNDERLALVEVA